MCCAYSHAVINSYTKQANKIVKVYLDTYIYFMYVFK